MLSCVLFWEVDVSPAVILHTALHTALYPEQLSSGEEPAAKSRNQQTNLIIVNGSVSATLYIYFEGNWKATVDDCPKIL